MALIKCPECGAEISDLATTCPKCGAPIAQSKDKLSSNLDEVDTILDMPWLAFLLPPLGFALYFLRRSQNPQKAKTLLVASCIGLAFDLGLFLWI